MKLSHLLTMSLAGAVVCFIGGAEASPHSQAPMFSPLPIQAGLKCGLVNGHIECGDSGGKHHDDADDDDDHHHKKKKNTDDDNVLSECTIQGENSGGGCKGGFKRVCEKLKSGKKCCGCVVDKNAKPAEAQQPVVQRVCCRGTYPNGVSTGGDGSDCGASEAAIRQSLLKRTLNGAPVKPDSISCVPEK
jgi:hypothetical protein